MLEYDPAVNLQRWPLAPMKKYGQNPYGDDLYRIVFTSSVRQLAGGGLEYHWIPRYPNIRSAWVLERWEPCKMSRREWERMENPFTGGPILGPYPARGEYELAWEFDAGVDADSLDNIIAAVERKRLRSYQDDRDLISQEYAQEDLATRKSNNDEIRDAVTAFGVAPISSLTGVSRGSKTAPELRSAEELGLPVPGRGRRPRDLRGLQMTSSLIAGRQNANS